MNELINIGKTVGVFGIKGELKVISDFEYLDKAFKVNNKVLINNIEHLITGIRYHKKWVLLEIDNLKNINLVFDYVGFNIYIKRDSLNLGEKEFLYSDLLGVSVYENDIFYGKIIEVLNGASILIRVKGEKEFLIPYVEEYIIKFDKDKKMLYGKNIDNLII